MQFKVPQNVQIEDKILPFMTLRQLVISGVGGGFTYLVYLLLEHQSPEVWMPPVFLMGALTLAVAFVQIKGIPFVHYILLVLERYLNETKRMWIKSAGDVFLPPAAAPKKKKSLSSARAKKKTTIRDVAELSRTLDHG